MQRLTLAEEQQLAAKDRKEATQPVLARGAQMAFAMVEAVVKGGPRWIAKRVERNVSRMR